MHGTALHLRLAYQFNASNLEIMENKKRIWIHWAFLAAIILYVCLFALESGKFFQKGWASVIKAF